jgi:hypothetical protein
VTHADDKLHRSGLFLAKAEKLLRWLRSYLGEMQQFGNAADLDNFERVLHSSLSLIASIHDALIDGAKLAGQTQWRAKLKALRTSDPLLYYLWKVRDVDIHDVLTTRAEGTESMFEVVDEKKLQPLLDSFGDITLEEVPDRMMRHLFHVQYAAEIGIKIRDGYRPPQEELDAVGVKLRFALTSFTFQEFTVREDGKKRAVKPPLKHGTEQIIPSAFTVVQQAYLFYARQLTALTNEIGQSASSPPALQGP